jgi:D-tagatose-1,6-bisphosphate aldolase subunit GatZ/KbaZ
VELIRHCETFRRAKGLPEISYEVGTEEVHGGLADERTFDTFIAELKAGLAREGLSDIWPCFIVGKVGTDLHTTLFDTEVARSLTAKVRPLGSYIKGHYTDGVSNPQDYPLCGMGAANVGPEFTMSEYDGLAELERTEQKLLAEGRIAMRSRITETLERLVEASGRWKKWLLPAEEGSAFGALSAERRTWLVKTGCRYIWQEPEALVARQRLYDNLRRVGMDPEEVVLGRIEHDMDKYFYAFNLVDLNNLL